MLELAELDPKNKMHFSSTIGSQPKGPGYTKFYLPLLRNFFRKLPKLMVQLFGKKELEKPSSQSHRLTNTDLYLYLVQEKFWILAIRPRSDEDPE